MKPRSLALLLLVALAAGGYLYLRPRAGREAPAIEFETVTLGAGPIVARVTATGTLSARVTVQVGSQVSGRVAELLADFNSNVKKGQVIARLDPQLFRAALEQARANDAAAEGALLEAKVQAAQAKRQLQRSRSLYERKLISLQELEVAQAAADVADAQIAAAAGRAAQTRAARRQAEVNLAFTIITSPIDGVVISRSVEPGQTVAASLQAPTLFVIAQDLAHMQVDTSVAESDVGKLHPDMKATFTVDAYPSERFEGRVRQIRNAPQTVQNVVTYDAVIDVQNPGGKLRPGMTANVSFVHAERDQALRVPNAALRFKPSADLFGVAATSPARDKREDRTQRTVWVLRAGKPVPVAVKTGITDGTYTELVSGELREGTAVITDAKDAARPAARPGGGLPMRRML